MSIPNLRKLNNYDFDGDFEKIVKFKKTGKVPENLSEIQAQRFIDKYEPFSLIKGELVYSGLQVIKKINMMHVLQLLYDDFTKGLFHGINQFYDIVTSKYLNITKKEVEDFLKQQINYQLTFRPKVRTIQVKKFNKPHEAYAMDLIDIHRYSTLNKNYSFILTMIDVFNSNVWLRPLKSKNADDIYKVLKPIFDKQKPKVLFMDNGGEFKGVNSDLFKELNIKVSYTPSHTPQPNIENLNGQLRNMLSKLFVHLKKPVWINHLQDIEENINNFNNLPKIVEKRNKTVEKRKLQPQSVVKPLYQVGDVVRINQTVFEPQVREQIKQGKQKYIHVKYSIHLFTIAKIYKPRKINSLPYYSVIFDDDILTNDHNNNYRRFKEKDLLLVKNVIGDNLTQQQNDRLNGLHYEEPQKPTKRVTRSKK